MDLPPPKPQDDSHIIKIYLVQIPEPETCHPGILDPNHVPQKGDWKPNKTTQEKPGKQKKTHKKIPFLPHWSRKWVYLQ